MGDMDNEADAVYDLLFGRGTYDVEDEGVVCKYCGVGYLWWQDVGGKMVLFEQRKNRGNFPHECNRGLSKTAILDSFSDVD